MTNTKYLKLLDAYNLYCSREFDEDDDTFTLDDLVNSNGILGVLYTDYEGYSDFNLTMMYITNVIFITMVKMLQNVIQPV